MKFSTSVASATPNDLISPLNEHRSLCSWLQDKSTQQWLEELESLASALNKLVLDEVPRSRESEILREQSIGEIRGLRRLMMATTIRKQELEELIQQSGQDGQANTSSLE
jgi:hypothetical protein